MRLDHVILGLLAMRRFSGYDLRKWLDGRGRYIGYGITLPQIYTRLAKLTERGWVSFDVEPREGRPDAKVYRLTDAGKEALWEWARSPYEPSPRPNDPDFMVRFLFAGQLDREIALTILRTELDYRLANFSSAELDLSGYDQPQVDEMDTPWANRVRRRGHELGYANNAAYIAWLQLTIGAFAADD